MRLSSRTRSMRRGSGGGKIRLLAMALVVVSATAAYVVLTRDVDWDRRSRAQRHLGDTAVVNGRFKEARVHYQEALADNPYDWRVHLALADILSHKLNAPVEALRHYLLTLAYSPTPSIQETVSSEVAILRLIHSGELENPFDAVEDMFQAVEQDAERLFTMRLSDELRGSSDVYWNAWTQRSRGGIADVQIVAGQDGMYDAAVELVFPDMTGLRLHLRCSLRDVWRMDLSFP